MKCTYACGSNEHVMARRQFLGGMAGGMVGGLGVMAGLPAAKKLDSTQQRVICIYMSGGLSQLESWDPKPKTDTGGPFRAIPTSVPGIHLSRIAAADGQAHGQAGPGSRYQHPQRRPWQG